MTAVRIAFLRCDGPGDDGGLCDVIFPGGDLQDAPTAKEVRRRAKADGWSVRLSGGRDLCPDCRRRPEEGINHG